MMMCRLRSTKGASECSYCPQKDFDDWALPVEVPPNFRVYLAILNEGHYGALSSPTYCATHVKLGGAEAAGLRRWAGYGRARNDVCR